MTHECHACGKQYVKRGNLLKHALSCRPCKFCGKTMKDKLLRHEKLCRGKLAATSSSTPERNGERHVETLHINDTKVRPFAGDDDYTDPLRDTIVQHWQSIRTFARCHTVQDVLNVRMWDPENDDYETDLGDLVHRVWNSSPCSAKLNASLGCLLVHKDGDRYRYFHSSSNNAKLLDYPRLVESLSNVDAFLDDITSMDLAERSVMVRPNTEWKLHALTNMTFYFSKMTGVGKIGDGDVKLPAYIKNRKSIIGLVTDVKTGKSYSDNLCVFRCLSILMSCGCPKDKCCCTRPSERRVVDLYNVYRTDVGISCESTGFPGIVVDDLVTVERLFDVSVNVFRLKANGSSEVVWSSKRQSNKTLNVNMYRNHFSYIKNLRSFCNSFVCRSCSAAFTRMSSLTRHPCHLKKVTRLEFTAGDFAR